MNKITVLFPGGFKPLTGAHLALAQRYAQHPEVDRVILLIGSKEREGITREKTMEMFNILNDNPNIEIQPTEFNSPIMAAYEYLFALPEDATGRYAMAASTKGDDYVRAKDFVPNVDKYVTIGDKKGRKMPMGIDATELSNLNPNGQLFFEINQYLGKETQELLGSIGLKNIELRKDIYGNDRMIACNF